MSDGMIFLFFLLGVFALGGVAGFWLAMMSIICASSKSNDGED